MTPKPTIDAAILVVEDDPQQLELMRLAIAELPAQLPVFEAVDGVDALQRLERSAASGAATLGLVILDLRLPRLHGLDVLAQAQRLGLTQQVPFVVLTTSDSALERDRACQSGACDYLVKPLGFRALQALVMGLYERWLVPRMAAG